MKQRFFITSTGTGIGKSFITTALVQQARALGRSVMAYKPVISGYNTDAVQDSDTGLILQSLGLPLTQTHIHRVSPWRFKAPLAPSMAARAEHTSIDFAALLAQGREVFGGPEDIVLIEGVGGVMAPLNEKETVIDWIEALHEGTVLVSGTYLGAISHTLTALTALQQRKIAVHAVIVSESENAEVSLGDTVDEVSRWTRLPIIPVRRHPLQNIQGVKELRALFN